MFLWILLDNECYVTCTLIPAVNFYHCIVRASIFSNLVEENDDGETEKVASGISFWIVYDWPEYGMEAMQSHFFKEFMESGLEISEVNAVKCRGNYK